MTRRILELAVCGPFEQSEEVAEVLSDISSRLLVSGSESPTIEVRALERALPDRDVASSHHLVVTAGKADSKWSDVSVGSVSEAELLVTERLVPWGYAMARGSPGPSGNAGKLTPADPAWAFAAARLIARIESHADGQEVLRIDHIGSTSVPGLAAKNLIDIQIVVASEGQATTVAQAVTNAGFAHVVGQWHGKDRTGDLHLEQVCVDSDPGRPVKHQHPISGSPGGPRCAAVQGLAARQFRRQESLLGNKEEAGRRSRR